MLRGLVEGGALDPGGVQDALTAKGRTEGVDRHALAEVVAVDRVDAEDRLRRVGVPVGDRARVDGQAKRAESGTSWKWVESLPRSASGKVLEQPLRQRYAATSG